MSTKKIFLHKSWIIKENPGYLRIVVPKKYFNRNSTCRKGSWICLSRLKVESTILDSDWLVATIDLDQVYQIISFNYETAKTDIELILGKNLYQELEAVEEQIRWIDTAKKNKYLSSMQIANLI